MTVLGERRVEELGIIAPHEHILMDVLARLQTSGAFPEIEEASRKKLRREKVSMRLLGELRLDVAAVLDNVVLDDVDLASEELLEFKKHGGDTVVDLTSQSMGRDVTELQKLSRLTGLHIVASTGFYVQPSHPDWVGKSSENEIARYMVKEVLEGIGDSGVRAGVIGEIGTSRGILPEEKRVLRGAAMAQSETGVALYAHTWPFGNDGNEVLNVLEESGARLQKVVVCHVDGRLHPEYCRSLLDRGACIGFDHFGKEYREILGSDIFVVPNDVDRLKEILELAAADRAYISRIQLSTDRCLKTELLRYGGHGYAHILRTIVPYMRRLGFSEEQINTLVVKNPQELLDVK
jgi:phosphotriesterase-related protein